MSQTEDKQYRVTWRSIPPPSISAASGNIGEVLEERTVTAAYYVREQPDKDRYVFKRADGMQTFDVAVALVETIEVVETAKAAA